MMWSELLPSYWLSVFMPKGAELLAVCLKVNVFAKHQKRLIERDCSGLYFRLL